MWFTRNEGWKEGGSRGCGVRWRVFGGGWHGFYVVDIELEGKKV